LRFACSALIAHLNRYGPFLQRFAALTQLSRKQAAEDAGMSRDQMHTALRVANVPASDFEQQVESAPLLAHGRDPRECDILGQVTAA